MGTTIYASGPSGAEQTLTGVADWVTANQVTAWTGGAVILIALLTLTVYRLFGAVKGRSSGAKAAIGYAVVQVGMAYVTITGGYDFWHLIAAMAPPEAAVLAIFTEAAQWVLIARTFLWMDAHADGDPHIGYGTAGRYFWLVVTGGSIIAILGAGIGRDNLPLAVGRTVVVVIGTLLWDLLLRERMHRDPSIPPTVLLLTWRKIGIRLGILSAERKDVRTQDREWTARRMARALRWKNEGVKLLRWWGERTLMRAMDDGDGALMSEAVQRYAMNWLIRHEVTAAHATMAVSLTAARRILNGEVIPAPPPPPKGQPEPTKQIILPPPARPRPRTVAATETQESVAVAAALRDEAQRWVMGQIRAGRTLTGREVAQQFNKKDEWGRLRLREAEALLKEADDAAA